MTHRMDKATRAYVARHGILVRSDDDNAIGYFTCAADQPCPPRASAEFLAGWDECDDELRFERAA